MLLLILLLLAGDALADPASSWTQVSTLLAEGHGLSEFLDTRSHTARSASAHARSATLYTDEGTFTGSVVLSGGLNMWDAELGNPASSLVTPITTPYTTTTFPDITITCTPSAGDMVSLGSGYFGGEVTIAANLFLQSAVYSFVPAQTVFGARIYANIGGSTAILMDDSGNPLASFPLLTGANFIGIDCPVPVASMSLTGPAGEVFGSFYLGISSISPTE
jgi:hypothetical protein